MTINSREIFNTMLDNDIVISYIGPFDGQILSLLASNIEDSLWDNQHRGKTFFKIFIELSQNIYLYSKEKGTGIDKSAGVGLMLIKEYDDHFAFITGNMVTKKDYELLSDKCKKICEKNKEELREFKRYMRGQPRTEFGGGNIGLIQVSILSGYPLDYSFIKVDEDDYFFILGVKIDK